MPTALITSTDIVPPISKDRPSIPNTRSRGGRLPIDCDNAIASPTPNPCVDPDTLLTRGKLAPSHS